MTPFSASTFSMAAAGRAMRTELMLKGTGVDIIRLAPGATLTPSFETLVKSATEKLSDLYPGEQQYHTLTEAVEGGVSPQVTSDALTDAVLATRPYAYYRPNSL